MFDDVSRTGEKLKSLQMPRRLQLGGGDDKTPDQSRTLRGKFKNLAGFENEIRSPIRRTRGILLNLVESGRGEPNGFRLYQIGAQEIGPGQDQ